MSWRDVPCKLWGGARFANGYGMRRVNKRLVRVHRWAWIEANGPIPPETPFVLHHCDTPACYEVEHLFLGTHADNVADRVSKGRSRNQHMGVTHCKHGHEFTPENTRMTSDGRRRCLQCVAINDQKRWGGT